MKLTYFVLQQMFPHPRGDNTTNELALLEQVIFDSAHIYSNDYQGGLWEAQTIDGCLFLVAPAGTYQIHVDTNFYQGIMDEHTFGAALTLLLYNHRLWEYHQADYDVSHQTDHYYSMLDAVMASPSLDGPAIARFLD